MQNERIMSLAASEIWGSGGKETGLDTILEAVSDEQERNGEIHTVYIFRLDSSSKMAGILLGTRRSIFPMPTSPQLLCVLSIE